MVLRCECGKLASHKCCDKVCGGCCTSSLCARHFSVNTKTQNVDFSTEASFLRYNDPELCNENDYNDILDNLQIKFLLKVPSDINYIIGEYTTINDDIICVVCTKYIDPENIWKCDACDFYQCFSCTDFKDVFKQCRNSSDCYYCRRGHCYNNQSLMICDKCWKNDSYDAKTEYDDVIGYILHN
jgi:hypothetical protein